MMVLAMPDTPDFRPQSPMTVKRRPAACAFSSISCFAASARFSLRQTCANGGTARSAAPCLPNPPIRTPCIGSAQRHGRRPDAREHPNHRTMYTLPPLPARKVVISLPMPEFAPVTTYTFPERSMVCAEAASESPRRPSPAVPKGWESTSRGSGFG
eukprot:scaffold7558_cov277-Pinguiococcus_pyrenoidosus.AAC.3